MHLLSCFVFLVLFAEIETLWSFFIVHEYYCIDICVLAIGQSWQQLLVWIAVIEHGESHGKSELFTHVARILTCEIHDVRVSPFVQKELDSVNQTILNAQVQSSVAVPVRVIDGGAANDEPVRRLKVLGK